MPIATTVAVLVTRAAHLVALAVVPFALSPEPTPVEAELGMGLVSAVALGAVCWDAAWARSRLASRPAAVGAALAWLAVASALGAAIYCDRQALPLGVALPPVGVLVWGSLAAFAAALARRAGRSAVLGAAPAVLLGAGLLATAAPWLRSVEAIHWRALRVDPSDSRALDALVGTKLEAGDLEGADLVAERCLAAQPNVCACLELRADVALHRSGEDARVPVAAAVDACPRDARAHLLQAQWFARAGDANGAERELATASVLFPKPSDLAYARAYALERSGRFEQALREADQAVAAGGGRDAKLLAAALRISIGDLAVAAAALEGLAAAYPQDPEVRYDLALIADKSGKYNAAREGYLATLRLEPKHRAARYNLAVLTLRAGAIDEARHHAEAFVRTFPGDAAGPQLLALVARATSPRH